MSEPNVAQNNEQILNDIQSLQEIEKSLLNRLEANTPTLTSEEQEQIVGKMNQISNMRINLYQTLSGVNNFFQGALSSSIGTLQQQTAAIGIIEDELNYSKKRLDVLENEKLNKIRLVEINDYYGEKYAEHSQLMKILIFTLVPIIILAILNNKGILPEKIYYILIGIISVIGSVFLWRRIASILMRDNMNYQEYNFFFNPQTAPSSISENETDPWAISINLGTCIGQNCCSDGQKWDDQINQCIGTSTVGISPTTQTTTESFIVESLTKTQPNKYKHDVDLRENFKASQSKSFVNK